MVTSRAGMVATVPERCAAGSHAGRVLVSQIGERVLMLGHASRMARRPATGPVAGARPGRRAASRHRPRRIGAVLPGLRTHALPARSRAQLVDLSMAPQSTRLM